MHNLTFALKNRKSESQEIECTYIDFIVTGQALSQLFEKKLDLIGTFGWTENKAEQNKQLDQFLGLTTAELKTGRTSFYVCANCGDIGCGAITALIEINDTTVIWKDFGYETDNSAPELAMHKNIGPFIFEKEAYRTVFEEIRPKT